MLTKEQVIKGLSDRNLSEVARRTGVNKTYLNLVYNGNRNMGEKTQRILSDYLKAKQWKV